LIIKSPPLFVIYGWKGETKVVLDCGMMIGEHHNGASGILVSVSKDVARLVLFWTWDHCLSKVENKNRTI